MKLAACYSVFNGLELLAGSIKQIVDQVDVVIVCYQYRSNTGNSSNDLRPPFAKQHLRELLSDVVQEPKLHLVQYHPLHINGTKQNERDKHNLMLDVARKHVCSHFLMAACDHYYKPDEFAAAKLQADAFDVTLTGMYTYYKHPTWRITPVEEYYMPFIMRLKSDTRFENVSRYPYRVDPALKVTGATTFGLFTREEIMLHHYSMLRVDIRDKFLNAAASSRWTPGDAERFATEYDSYDLATNPGISYFGGRKVEVVEDLFAINVCG